MRTRVKICGITRPEDGLAAARNGADAIGIVCYPKARRFVPRERALQIVSILPAFVMPVGLFVDAKAAEIRQVAADVGLRCLQLHGQESPRDVMELADFSVLKSVRVERGAVRQTLAQWRKAISDHRLPNLRALLLETATDGVGGTGVENDWDMIKTLQTEGALDGLPPIIVAGGLRPETVGDIVRAIRPYAVDVSSGVEESGVKSVPKIKHFIREVQQADQSI